MIGWNFRKIDSPTLIGKHFHEKGFTPVANWWITDDLFWDEAPSTEWRLLEMMETMEVKFLNAELHLIYSCSMHYFLKFKLVLVEELALLNTFRMDFKKRYSLLL